MTSISLPKNLTGDVSSSFLCLSQYQFFLLYFAIIYQEHLYFPVSLLRLKQVGLFALDPLILFFFYCQILLADLTLHLETFWTFSFLWKSKTFLYSLLIRLFFYIFRCRIGLDWISLSVVFIVYKLFVVLWISLFDSNHFQFWFWKVFVLNKIFLNPLTFLLGCKCFFIYFFYPFWWNSCSVWILSELSKFFFLGYKFL